MIEVISILLIFFLCYFLILKNFNYSVYLLLVLSVLLHKELFSFYSWNLMPIRAYMLALLCASITYLYLYFTKNKNFKEPLKRTKDPVFISLIVLWVIRGVSIIFSMNIQASLLLYAFFTTIVFLCGYLYLNIKENPETVLKFIKFYIYLVFGLTIFGYVQILVLKFTGVTIGALWSIPGNIPRVGATFWDVNHYGALLSALIPVLGVFILTEKCIKKKLFYIVMFLSMCMSLLLTNSRSAWIMAFITFIAFICILLVRKFGLKGILYLIITLTVITLPLLNEYSIKSSPFRAKIKQYFHYRMDSFDSHFLLLTGAVQVFEKYPVLGGGYGSFFEHFSKTKVAPTYFGRDPAAFNTRVPAHTIWGELVSETGVLGLMAFLIITALFILPALYVGLKSKIKQEFLLGSVISSLIVGWVMAGIFYSYNSEFFWIVLFLFAGWAVGVSSRYLSVKEIFVYFFAKEKSAVIFLLILGALMIFVGLGKNHLIPYDEAIYAKISKNMVLNNDFLVQNWIPGKVWYEKPPLFMWMVAGFMKLLGYSSWAAKLPSAIFGFLSLTLVYLFAKKMFGKMTGFLSAFVLLTTTQYLYYSRMAMLDVTATFFITLALVLYYYSRLSQKKYLVILSGLAVGLAVMVKGVVGFLPFPIIFLYELYLFITKQQKFTKTLFTKYFLMLFFACAVFLPWHLEMYKMFGEKFINNYIIYHVWDRATSAIEDKGRPFLWYITVLRVSMRIWFIALLAAFPLAVFKALKKKNASVGDHKHFVFLLIWALIVFLFFSSAKSKLVWYIMPVYPVLSIFVGYLMSLVINFALKFIKAGSRDLTKISVMSFIVVSSLFYLFLNKELVYTSDLVGSQARLLQYKDSFFGTEKMVYVDRIELPLSLYYTDGPFKEIDFNPQKVSSVPSVDYQDQLILLTKKGRYSEEVAGYSYGPKLLLEDGDWVLWYFEAEYDVDKGELSEIQKNINAINSAILLNKPYTGDLNLLKQQEEELTAKMQAGLGPNGFSY